MRLFERSRRHLSGLAKLLRDRGRQWFPDPADKALWSRLKLHAQALTFDTLLGLVPLLVILGAVVQAYSDIGLAVTQLQGLLLEQLAATPDVEAVLVEVLGGITRNVDLGSLGTLPVLLLLASVLGLLGHMDQAINAIFHTPTSRSWGRRMVVSASILVAAPALLGASFALTAALQHSWVMNWLQGLGAAPSWFIARLPLVVTWFAFALLYKWVPHSKVRWGSALVGAVVAGTLWHLAKLGYAVYAARALTVRNLYGSLATVPMFILWLYVSWFLVLLGAYMTSRQQRRMQQKTAAARG